jgi:hypothetical protein
MIEFSTVRYLCVYNMGKETPTEQPNQQKLEPIEKVKERLRSINNLVVQRESLKERIGIEGKVQVGSSEETTLRVGRVRNRVENSIQRLKNKTQTLLGEIEGYETAEDYLKQKKSLQRHLASTSEQVDRGETPKRSLSKLQNDYSSFTQRSERDPGLRKGIERRRQEQEERKNNGDTPPSEASN